MPNHDRPTEIKLYESTEKNYFLFTEKNRGKAKPKANRKIYNRFFWPSNNAVLPKVAADVVSRGNMHVEDRITGKMMVNPRKMMVYHPLEVM